MKMNVEAMEAVILVIHILIEWMIDMEEVIILEEEILMQDILVLVHDLTLVHILVHHLMEEIVFLLMVVVVNSIGFPFFIWLFSNFPIFLDPMDLT